MKRYKDTNFYLTEEGFCYNPKGKRIGSVAKNGYYRVGRYLGTEDGVHKKKYYHIHRMIAELFIPNPDNLPQVNHIDGNKLNNDITNLEWCTTSHNIQHAFDNNLNQNQGENHHNAAAPDYVVKWMREQYDTGKYTIARIWRASGLKHRTTAWRLIRGKSRKNQ